MIKHKVKMAIAFNLFSSKYILPKLITFFLIAVFSLCLIPYPASASTVYDGLLTNQLGESITLTNGAGSHTYNELSDLMDDITSKCANGAQKVSDYNNATGRVIYKYLPANGSQQYVTIEWSNYNDAIFYLDYNVAYAGVQLGASDTYSHIIMGVNTSSVTSCVQNNVQDPYYNKWVIAGAGGSEVNIYDTNLTFEYPVNYEGEIIELPDPSPTLYGLTVQMYGNYGIIDSSVTDNYQVTDIEYDLTSGDGSAYSEYIDNGYDDPYIPDIEHLGNTPNIISYSTFSTPNFTPGSHKLYVRWTDSADNIVTSFVTIKTGTGSYAGSMEEGDLPPENSILDSVQCGDWDVLCYAGQIALWIFIPDPVIIQNYIDESSETFKNHLGFIAYPFTFIFDLLVSLSGASGTPSCTLSFGQVWGADYDMNICILEDNAPSVFTSAQTILVGVLSFSLLFALNNKLQGVLKQQ